MPVTEIDYLPEVIDFCWQQTQVGPVGYPTSLWQLDGLTDMIEKTWKYPSDEILVWRETELQAVVCLFVDTSEKYLQTIGGIYTVDLGIAPRNLLDYRDQVYPGYELLIGYPDREDIRQTLGERDN